MGGQRRACAVIVVLCALTTGCATDAGAGIECTLPENTRLVPAPDGGMHVEGPGGTRALLSFANGSCALNSYTGALPRAERSEEQLAFTYDYYRQSLVPCLDDLGFRSLAPPSRGAFIASGGNWSPYDSVYSSLLDSTEIAALAELCPEAPPAP